MSKRSLEKEHSSTISKLSLKKEQSSTISKCLLKKEHSLTMPKPLLEKEPALVEEPLPNSETILSEDVSEPKRARIRQPIKRYFSLTSSKVNDVSNKKCRKNCSSQLKFYDDESSCTPMNEDEPKPSNSRKLIAGKIKYHRSSLRGSSYYRESVSPAVRADISQRDLQLSADTKEYLQRLSVIIAKEKDQMTGEALDGVLNQLHVDNVTLTIAINEASFRILIKLIAMGNLSQVIQILGDLKNDYVILLSISHGTAVLEAIFQKLSLLVNRENAMPQALVDGLICFLKLINMDNIEELLLTRPIQVNCLRFLIQSCLGINVEDKLMRWKRHIKHDLVTVIDKSLSSKENSQQRSSLDWLNPKLLKRFDSFLKIFISLANFNELITTIESVSSVIQTLLVSFCELKMYTSFQAVVQAIMRANLELASTDSSVRSICRVQFFEYASHPIASPFIEKLVECASSLMPEIFVAIYECVKKSILDFGLHPIANYTLQVILINCPSDELFGKVSNRVCAFLDSFLAHGHFGILNKLIIGAGKCKCSSHRVAVMDALQLVFGCKQPPERQSALIYLLGALVTYDVMCPTPNTVPHFDQGINYHGSVIIQSLLHWPQADCQPLISSLSLPPDQLSRLCRDQFGSFILDTFFASPTIERKSKSQLFENILSANPIDLAKSKFGSRVLESAWHFSSISKRAKIAKSLQSEMDSLKSDQYGVIIFNNFALKYFTLRRTDWVEMQKKVDASKTKNFKKNLET